MSRFTRLILGTIFVAFLAAGLVVYTDSAGAQPPEGKQFKKDKGSFKGKGFPWDKSFQREGDRDRGGNVDRNETQERINRLQEELEHMRARQGEIQEQIRDLRESMRGGERPRETDRGGGRQTERGPMPRGGARGGMGGGMMRGGPMGGGFGPRGMMGGFGPGFGPPAIERMSPQQIKEMIGHLQRVLEEKTRGDRGGDMGERRGRPPEEELMHRLDKLTREIEDIRRSMKK